MASSYRGNGNAAALSSVRDLMDAERRLSELQPPSASSHMLGGREASLYAAGGGPQAQGAIGQHLFAAMGARGVGDEAVTANKAVCAPPNARGGHGSSEAFSRLPWWAE